MGRAFLQMATHAHSLFPKLNRSVQSVIGLHFHLLALLLASVLRQPSEPSIHLAAARIARSVPQSVCTSRCAPYSGVT